jgi:hypothetical protein
LAFAYLPPAGEGSRRVEDENEDEDDDDDDDDDRTITADGAAGRP